MNDCSTTQAGSGEPHLADNNAGSAGSQPSLTKTGCDRAPFGLLDTPTVIPREGRMVRFDGNGKQVNLGGRPIRSVEEIAEKHRVRKEFLEHRRKNRIKHIRAQMRRSQQQIRRIQINLARWAKELIELDAKQNG